MIVADTINPLAFKLKLLKVKTSCKIAKLATLLLAMIILALSISLMLLLPCDILFLLLSSVYNCLLLWVTWNIGISRHLVWAGNLSRSAQHEHTLFTYVHRDLHKNTLKCDVVVPSCGYIYIHILPVLYTYVCICLALFAFYFNSQFAVLLIAEIFASIASERHRQRHWRGPRSF